ncbi:patatin-like phospholipase family protein [Sulfitobacter sp. F26169L]|uniref:patatin-like phospholipase family protein n=1 Tax=Sulfitobacter sp. F26169L TaxID=2996015 RepID=UPI0022609348|nr:patatin-like phospholipase family protein [Sulfitobacter sp. F26169L]MCX7567387.1 patatin-like phospholipase family protein [Sulfitobacter sp. F26169L]
MNSIALALGAGGARGIAHIHVFKAFDDLGLKPAAIAGTSIGSLMGAAYASGMTGRDIETYVNEIFNDRKKLLTQALKVRPRSIGRFFADGGPRLGEFNLETILSVFLPDTVADTFEALHIPLFAVATDYYAQQSHVFSSGALQKALAASAAMPAVFLPVEIAQRFFIDGSSTDPCPLECLQNTADAVLAVDVSGGPVGTPDIRPNKIDVMYASSQIMQQSIVRAKADRYPETILLRPPVSNYRSLDFLKVSEILAETAGLRDLVKRQLDAIYNGGEQER